MKFQPEWHPCHNIYMENNFEKKIHIRSLDANQKIKDRVIHHIKNSHSEGYLESQKNSITPEEAMGSDSLEKINTLYGIVNKKFSDRGITEANLGEVLFSKILAEDIGTMARYGSYVELFDLDISVPELKQLVYLKNLGHELYHSAAKLSFNLTITNEKISYNMENSGAGYGTEETNALEEGSAIIFEKEVFNEVKKLFSDKIIDLYNQIKEHCKKLPTDDIDDLEILVFNEETRENAVSDNIPYKNSKLLVEYIASRIPNFFNILEKARIERKTLDLARAIEKEFGEGSYRKITTASIDEAKELLKELQEIKN